MCYCNLLLLLWAQYEARVYTQTGESLRRAFEKRVIRDEFPAIGQNNGIMLFFLRNAPRTQTHVHCVFYNIIIQYYIGYNIPIYENRILDGCNYYYVVCVCVC